MIRALHIDYRRLLSVCLAMSFLTCMSGQKLGEHVVVTLQDSSIITGTITHTDDAQIAISSTAIKKLNISRSDILSIDRQQRSTIPLEKGWHASPIYSINYLTESAIPLSEGEIYYQNILLYGQKFGIGISDRFSINAGFELATLIHGEGIPGFLIAPKYSLSNGDGDFHFGFGANFLVVPNGSRNELAGTLFGLVTFGDKETNLTLGVGTAFYESDLADLPVLQLSGQFRVARHIGLILDSISVFDGNNIDHVASFFVRYVHPKFIIDLGSVFEVGFDYGIPMVNFAMKIQE